MSPLGSLAQRIFKRQPIAGGRLYCDYAAATPILPAAADLMDEINRSTYGNAGAIHTSGVRAARIVADARLTIARTLGVRPAEVIFTASGTEANNLAIIGYLEARAGAAGDLSGQVVITTKLEHPSVLAVLEKLTQRGLEVRFVPVHTDGQIDRHALESLLAPNVSLVTFAYANSEVGTVQDVKRLSRLLRMYNRANQASIKFHLDAAQAPLWLPCQLHQLGVDLLSLDAGKCHGPKGLGVLVKRSDVPLERVMHGGGQESGWRAGTENTAAIAGAALAISDAQEHRLARAATAYQATQVLVAALQETVPEAIFNGPAFVDDLTELARLPNNVHISLPGQDTEYGVIYLDSKGIAASTRSACSGAGEGASAVVLAMTDDVARAKSTIRLTLDPTITSAEVHRIASVLRQWIDLQQTV